MFKKNGGFYQDVNTDVIFDVLTNSQVLNSQVCTHINV